MVKICGALWSVLLLEIMRGQILQALTMFISLFSDLDMIHLFFFIVTDPSLIFVYVLCLYLYIPVSLYIAIILFIRYSFYLLLVIIIIIYIVEFI